jgi:hypothetical protein
MIFPFALESQSHLITPAALAVTEPPPSITEQRWIFQTNGVALIDMKGTGSQWHWDQLLISPNLFFGPSGVLIPVLSRYSIPHPPGTPGQDWVPWMQVENWYPFVTLSSIFDQNTAVNAGFAVDRWTPQSRPGKEAVTGKTIQGLLSGLVVDLAVRDIDAILHRVSYSIVVQGKIRFVTSVS